MLIEKDKLPTVKCFIEMKSEALAETKEKENGEWKISVRTGARVNATRACQTFGDGRHRAASGCVLRGMAREEATRAIVQACREAADA